ncbi:hypothetical protein OBBRIDRAFT_742938, partial [Obba rivulosa]
TYNVPYHHIPNVPLATVDNRHIVLIMFPSLVNLDHFAQKQPLTREQNEQLYEDCIRATVLELLPGEEGHWPHGYTAEMQRIRARDSRLRFGTQQIPSALAHDFGERLLVHIRQKTWGRAAFFFHQIRGVRGATQHDFDDRVDAMEGLLGIFNTSDIHVENWWVDVGYELQANGRVLWWRTDAHWRLLRYALKLDDLDAEIATRSSGFTKDLACQLTEVSGFRMEVNSRSRGNTGITYIQAYCTEKTPTYLLDGRFKSKQLDLVDVLTKPTTISTFMSDISDIWMQARERFPGYARIEARVPLAHSGTQIVDTTAETLQHCIVAFEMSQWW